MVSSLLSYILWAFLFSKLVYRERTSLLFTDRILPVLLTCVMYICTDIIQYMYCRCKTEYYVVETSNKYKESTVQSGYLLLIR